MTADEVGAPDNITVSATDDTDHTSHPVGRPCLFLVLESHRPLFAPLRIALDDFDEIVFGRGSARAHERETAGGVRTLRIWLDDDWLSRQHARLTRVFRRWILEDLGSKNGSFVDGVRRGQAELTDGAVIELGHVFLLYRDAVVFSDTAPQVVDAQALVVPAVGLATLSAELARSFERLAVVARAPISVLIEGPTGSGKEVVARAIHDISQRTGPFVAVNCGALPRDLIEAELFGHRKGAFSGATEDHAGLVRSADGGTLLLDEIGDLPARSQAAFLRVLQDHEVRPVGGTRAVRVDLRVVAATHRSIDRMVEQGEFRADLFARLAGHRIELPSLGLRREDMGLLLAALIRRADPSLSARLRIEPAAVRAMLRYDWPGNVRELEKCVATALLLAHDSGRLQLEHLPEPVRAAALAATATKQETDDDARRNEIAALLRQHDGNVAAVARAMGKARMQIQRWIKRFGIDVRSFRR
jgi:DNA-binding NtrC family response regulator